MDILQNMNNHVPNCVNIVCEGNISHWHIVFKQIHLFLDQVDNSAIFHIELNHSTDEFVSLKFYPKSDLELDDFYLIWKKKVPQLDTQCFTYNISQISTTPSPCKTSKFSVSYVLSVFIVSELRHSETTIDSILLIGLKLVLGFKSVLPDNLKKDLVSSQIEFRIPNVFLEQVLTQNQSIITEIISSLHFPQLHLKSWIEACCYALSKETADYFNLKTTAHRILYLINIQLGLDEALSTIINYAFLNVLI
ncbi:hypothetical protein C8P68_1148 [Mucilaginibacter yixingensis]|uniref:Uncharacterized protein n=1 Tax=Mucilaginibacter yixingensis TaxID=1295612 RepID=A0A2T5J4C5_9SPHI|nr:hypothetical protein [Mucilaginibacter yixingensis]PTQ92133.1 hypothetical protein C8P68_1148 [Mucilaginibacter yixingensis]